MGKEKDCEVLLEALEMYLKYGMLEISHKQVRHTMPAWL